MSVIVLIAVLSGACGPAAAEAPAEVPTQAPAEPFTLTSPAFADGGEMAVEYSYSMGAQCGGENLRPPLQWDGTPAGTRSLALTMIDPDGANWVHWVHFDLPPEVTELPEGPGGPDGGPAVGVRGLNHFGDLGYAGPCPPGGVHHYTFTLYALDTLLSLPEGATNAQLTIAMSGHVLAEARLIGTRAP
jgi:Raf kinase inhibitor-like YbhB/YbcL family protein